MEKKMLTYTTMLAAFLSMVIFSSFNEQGAISPKEEVLDAPGLQQHITGFDLNKTFSLAGEDIPAGNFDAIERLDRELVINSYYHSATLLNLKMAHRYFPVIEPILKANGVPDDFKYLAVAESNLRMAVSPAGAKGLWQFMKPTGEAYGLEINSEIDERYHVEKSTEAACQFILKLKERFGSWTLAAAAYNMGETKLNQEIALQKATTYYELNLNQETSRYVFRIIAIKEVMEDPERFGYYVSRDQGYPQLSDYTTITVDTAVPSLADLAIKNGSDYRLLKVYNPWLIQSQITNKNKKTYEIRIPDNS